MYVAKYNIESRQKKNGVCAAHLSPRVKVALGESVVFRWSCRVEDQVSRHPTNHQHQHDPENLHYRRLVHHLRDVILRRS